MQVYLESNQAYFKSSSVYMEKQTYQEARITARPHIHAALELLLIQDGDFEIGVGDRGYLAHPGDLLLVRSNTIHHCASLSTGGAAYWVLKIQPSFITEIAATEQCGEYLMFFALERDSSKSFWTRQEMAGTPLQTALDQLLSEYGSQYYGTDIGIRLAMAHILLSIMREAHAQAPTQELRTDETVARRIYDGVIFINQNYNQSITAQDCCKICCMSYSYFSRTFRAVTGKNFKEYLNHVRITHAEEMLLTSDSSVTQVAASCGYDNVSYFISVYKRIKGVTPHATAMRKKTFGGAVRTT